MMKIAIGIRTTAAAMAMIALLSGCNNLPGLTNGPTASGTVCFWIAADKDAYVSCGRTASCEEGDLNFGRHGSLVVASGPLGNKRSYVHFTPPELPPGTEILEAKFELFHGGKNEDGFSDDISLNVARLSAPWSPETITWNNRPDFGSPSTGEFALRLQSQAWSGTDDISGVVAQIFDDPDAFHGFVVSVPQQFFSQQIEKGFYSNNDIRRKSNDLGTAPRLLVKVQLPPGTTTNDIVLPPFLIPDHDLDHLAQPILMTRFVGSADWPSDWAVSP